LLRLVVVVFSKHFFLSVLRPLLVGLVGFWASEDSKFQKNEKEQTFQLSKRTRGELNFKSVKKQRQKNHTSAGIG
jgi:hypothetical protein